MQVEFCIDTSVKVGFEYGYKITIVEDAVSTFDNEHLSADKFYPFIKKRFGKIDLRNSKLQKKS